MEYVCKFYKYVNCLYMYKLNEYVSSVLFIIMIHLYIQIKIKFFYKFVVLKECNKKYFKKTETKFCKK